MSERIEVGDLVMQVKTCCEKQGAYFKTFGAIFVVETINTVHVKCAFCGWERTQLLKAYGEKQSPVEWLKRIPPLSKLETQQERETCPASS